MGFVSSFVRALMIAYRLRTLAGSGGLVDASGMVRVRRTPMDSPAVAR
jgi:hypothetical protein